MNYKKQFLYHIETEDEEGHIKTRTIYKKGRNMYIDHHLVHPSAKTLDDELRIVFKEIRTKNCNFVICLNCSRRIYADEINYLDNNSVVACPHCECKMAFVLQGPLNEVKLLKII